MAYFYHTKLTVESNSVTSCSTIHSIFCLKSISCFVQPFVGIDASSSSQSVHCDIYCAITRAIVFVTSMLFPALRSTSCKPLLHRNSNRTPSSSSACISNRLCLSRTPPPWPSIHNAASYSLLGTSLICFGYHTCLPSRRSPSTLSSSAAHQTPLFSLFCLLYVADK